MSTSTMNRPKSVENIKVLQVGQFGVRVDDKVWFGTNEPLTPQNFQVGEGYKVAVVTSKTGKKYISEIMGVAEDVKQEAPVVKTKTETKAAPKADAPVTSVKLDEKSIQIQRQGLYQAALQSPVLSQFVTGNNVQEYLKLVREAAEAGIAFVAER